MIRQIKEKWIKKISFPGGGSLVFIHNKKKYTLPSPITSLFQELI